MTDQLEFLFKITPTRPEMLIAGSTDHEGELVSQHFSYLQTLWDKGILILARRNQNTDESSFGIVIFRAVSKMETQKDYAQRSHSETGCYEGGIIPLQNCLDRGKRQRTVNQSPQNFSSGNFTMPSVKMW